MVSRAVRCLSTRNQNNVAEQSIILFDGVCNLCNGFVNFLIPRDEENRFQFGSLQSDKVKELMRIKSSKQHANYSLLTINNSLFDREIFI